MTLHTYDEIEQGSDEWLQARCGILTASVMGQLITAKTIKLAENETARALTRSLVAEKITGRVEDSYMSRDMERGVMDEPLARDHYAKHYAPVEEVGFMVRDDWGFKIGYSPDGVVGTTGLIEVKSRGKKVQLQTILDDEIPPVNMAQLQCGLLVSGREWIDYLSWSGGMPMWRKRVYPDRRWFDAITSAAREFEKASGQMIARYQERTEGLPPTEHVDHFADMEIQI